MVQHDGWDSRKINWGNSRSPGNSYSRPISFFHTYLCVVVSEYFLEDFCGGKIIHIICLSFIYYYFFYQQIYDVSIDFSFSYPYLITWKIDLFKKSQ